MHTHTHTRTYTHIHALTHTHTVVSIMGNMDLSTGVSIKPRRICNELVVTLLTNLCTSNLLYVIMDNDWIIMDDDSFDFLYSDWNSNAYTLLPWQLQRPLPWPSHPGQQEPLYHSQTGLPWYHITRYVLPQQCNITVWILMLLVVLKYKHKVDYSMSCTRLSFEGVIFFL